MKVILAGYSKTGTKTMAAAFTMLGLNTYDYMENYFYLHKGWMKIFDGSATDEDIRKMFDGVDALTDAPVPDNWEVLHQAFPEAKIVLTIRDEDSWYKSITNQLDVHNKSYVAWLMETFSPQSLLRRSFVAKAGRSIAVSARWPRNTVQLKSEECLRKHYRKHNETVLKKAPKDKLLVYKVSEGWEPLCEFLGVEIPDKPFPHKNIRGNILDEMIKSDPIIHQMLLQGAITASVLALCTGYAGYRFYKSGSGEKLASWVAQNVVKAVDVVRHFRMS